ncbi:hypothetical protein EMIT0158MI4_80062 [Burkholderia ambifaria]
MAFTLKTEAGRGAGEPVVRGPTVGGGPCHRKPFNCQNSAACESAGRLATVGTAEAAAR